MGFNLHELQNKATCWLRSSDARWSPDLRRARISWTGTSVSYSAHSIASLGRAKALSGMENRGFDRDYDCNRLLTALIEVTTFL
jgi:hypothetical protein